MTTDGSLEETDQLVDDVIADLLKVTENSGPEEYLGVADAVAVLVNGRAEDDLRDLLVVFHGQLRTLKETNSDQLCHTFFVSLTKRENCLQKWHRECGGVVASFTIRPGFKSSQQQILLSILITVNCLNKTNNKEKEAENSLFN